MSDYSKKTEDNSQQNLGKKVTEEWNKFTENIPDVKKEIEDIINSVEEGQHGGESQGSQGENGGILSGIEKTFSFGSVRGYFWWCGHHSSLWSNENDLLKCFSFKINSTFSTDIIFLVEIHLTYLFLIYNYKDCTLYNFFFRLELNYRVC